MGVKQLNTSFVHGKLRAQPWVKLLRRLEKLRLNDFFERSGVRREHPHRVIRLADYERLIHLLYRLGTFQRRKRRTELEIVSNAGTGAVTASNNRVRPLVSKTQVKLRMKCVRCAIDWNDEVAAIET
ncbi:hypothetical protein [Bradyrhizobium sp. BR 1432]|uniref:hypothetical protein n=1 Tax=Bradyrhizobium sp. BR 1432 TaxID=3447966 RepID=UPI003EE73537